MHQLAQMSRNDPDFKAISLAQPIEIQGVKTTTHPLHDLHMKQYDTLAHVIVKETEYDSWEPRKEDKGRDVQKLHQAQKNLRRDVHRENIREFNTISPIKGVDTY